MNLADLVRLNARSRGGALALVSDDGRFTYRELDAAVDRVAAALRAHGVGHGDRVAVLSRNSAYYVFLYYALARIGALLVPMNFWHRSSEHDYVLRDSGPVLVFAQAGFEHHVQSTAADLSAQVVRLPGEADASGWEEFLAAATTPAGTAATSEGDAHMMLYTSGTTGRPKGALLAHGRTVRDAYAMSLALGVRSDDVFVNHFPPFHVGNWDHLKLFHLVGATVVLLPQFDAGRVLEVIESEQVTVLLAVPVMLHELMEHPGFATRDRSSLRLVYYAGYDPSGIMRRVEEEFDIRDGRVELAQIYGLTEAGPFVTVLAPHEVADHWSSIGRAIPGVDLVLLDPEGNEVAQGEPGEICIRGPRMSGYWNNPEETALALRGGWLHTGDVAIADQDGFLRIVDRLKDAVRTGGQNVYCKEVENTLLEHPAVTDSAVIGLPDEVYEERVVAIVVLADGVTGSPDLVDELQAHVRSSMAGYNTPKEVHFVDVLPKSIVGKTLKQELRARFGSAFVRSAEDAPSA